MKKLIPLAVATALLALTACSSGDYAAAQIPAEPEAGPTTATTPAAPRAITDGQGPLAVRARLGGRGRQ